MREALELAGDTNRPGEDIIVFAPWVQDIELTGSQLVVDSDVRIAGPGEDLLTIDGGGLSRVLNISSGTDAKIGGLTITGGYTGDNGAGISAYNADLTLRRVTIIGNENLDTGAGGLYVNSGTAQLIDSTIEDNLGAMGTGGVSIVNADFNVYGSTIDRNVGIYGGLTYYGGSNSLSIVNSTISGNVGVDVGGLEIGSAGDATLISTTVFNNSVAYPYGVIGGISSGTGVIVHNTIIAGNHRGTSGSDIIGTFAGGSANNLIGYDPNEYFPSGNNMIGVLSPIDPLLGPLMNNGGRTKTHALQTGSDAINAGNNDYVDGTIGDLIPYDQRGADYLRIKEGTADIGAYESMNMGSMGVGSAAAEMDGLYVDDELSLREALMLAALTPGPEHIYFRPELVGGTIDVLNGDIVIDSDVEIFGPGAGLLTIDAHQNSRIFHILAGVDATISGLTVSNGKVTGSGGWGGGILNWGNLSLDDVVVSHSEASVQGGGIASSGTLLVRRSTISDNTAPVAGGIGVKTDLADSTLIIDSSILNNLADHAGGVRFDDNSNISGPSSRIVNSTFSGNKSRGHGGAIVNTPYYVLTIINSTITENVAGYTTTTGEGGGIYNSGGGIVMHNTILAGNTAVIAYWTDFSGNSIAGSSHNLIGVNGSTGLTNGNNGNLVGTSSAELDPLLTALGEFGGPTKTHALLSTSLAIDAGSNDMVDDFFSEFELELTDQRGGTRIVDWDDLGGERVDIGAVELAFDEVYS